MVLFVKHGFCIKMCRKKMSIQIIIDPPIDIYVSHVNWNDDGVKCLK